MSGKDTFNYFLTLDDNSVRQGVAEEGSTVKDVLLKEGVSADRIARNEIAGSIDGVIADISARLESRNESGIVQLAISVKADNG